MHVVFVHCVWLMAARRGSHVVPLLEPGADWGLECARAEAKAPSADRRASRVSASERRPRDVTDRALGPIWGRMQRGWCVRCFGVWMKPLMECLTNKWASVYICHNWAYDSICSRYKHLERYLTQLCQFPIFTNTSAVGLTYKCDCLFCVKLKLLHMCNRKYC
jgi:hypothetical protein